MLTTTTQPTPTDSYLSDCRRSPQVGDIWKDHDTRRHNKTVVILLENMKAVVCQDLKTGKIASVRRKQFNRGKTGYWYAGSLSRQIDGDSKKLLTFLTKSYANYLAKIAGNTFRISISKR